MMSETTTKSSRRMWNALYSRSPKIKKTVLYIVLIGFCLVIPNLALPALAQVFIDRILLSHVLSWETGIVIGMLLAIGGIAFLTYLQRNTLRRLNARLSLQLASDTFWRMLRLPIVFYTQHNPAEIAYRLTLNESISTTLTGNLAITLINVMFAFVFGIAILYYDLVISLTAFAMVLLNLFVMRLTYRARTDAYLRYEADYRKSMAYSLGALQNIETIKASGMEGKFFSQWAGYYTNVINILQELGKKDVLLNVLALLMDSLTTFVLIAVGVWRIINGYLSIGMFVALQLLLRNFIGPVMKLAGYNQTIQLLKIDVAQIDDIAQHPIDPMFKEKAEHSPTDRLQGHIAVEEVVFGYGLPEEPILKGISFEIQPGKMIALVGPTGCGKSTIAKLIAGLYQPWSGKIFFDHKLREEIPRKHIVDSLAFVEQEPFLFNGTVMENLTLLDPTVPSEDVFRAAMDACIHEDILSRPGGYDMEVGENGSNLSGGEKQRFEVARALIKNPSVLIMDEVTNAVDSSTEAEIIKNIRARGCAILMIAHTLNTIRKCDEIIVIDNGKIAAQGTHDALKANSPLYRELIVTN